MKLRKAAKNILLISSLAINSACTSLLEKRCSVDANLPRVESGEVEFYGSFSCTDKTGWTESHWAITRVSRSTLKVSVYYDKRDKEGLPYDFSQEEYQLYP